MNTKNKNKKGLKAKRNNVVLLSAIFATGSGYHGVPRRAKRSGGRNEIRMNAIRDGW